MNATEREQGNILNGSVFVWTTIGVQAKLVYAYGLACLYGGGLEELEALVRWSLGCLWGVAIYVGGVVLGDGDIGDGGLCLLCGEGHGGIVRGRRDQVIEGGEPSRAGYSAEGGGSGRGHISAIRRELKTSWQVDDPITASSLTSVSPSHRPFLFWPLRPTNNVAATCHFRRLCMIDGLSGCGLCGEWRWELDFGGLAVLRAIIRSRGLTFP